ncbi:MAG TPA: VWA domain-containing protein [Blastocatellia bacterium]|nr:VWA domain-containing protein [Blastocatellia bacterium]
MRTNTIRKRAVIACAVVGLMVGVFAPSSWIAEAQSGRKPPEKARKEQPAQPAEPGQPAPDQQPAAPPLPPLQAKDLQDAVVLSTSVVNVETVVYEKKTGQILQGLKASNFEIYEDGVKQEITNFQPSEGPMTAVMIIEYNRRIDNRYIDKGEVLRPLYTLVTQFVRPDDNIAIVAFDTRPIMITDFTGDKKELGAGLDLLIRNNPTFSEASLYDALAFVLNGGKAEAINWNGGNIEKGVEYGGLKDVKNRSAIILVTLGIDTFSKLNYDETRKIIAQSSVPIYCIGVGNLFYKTHENQMDPVTNMTFLQAHNALKTFSRMTGGQYFEVTFPGEIPTDMQSITNLMRSQYSIGYTPSNTRRDGKVRKIVVKVDVNGDGNFDDKGYVIQARDSYIEPLDPRK